MGKKILANSQTELSYWFCLTLLCLFPSVCDSLRYVNAQATPMQDAYLNSTPLQVQFSSKVKCVELCTQNILCMSINYFEDTTCQLLQDFLCNDNNILISHTGAQYFDVDFGRTEQELNYFRNKFDCVSANKCSPKCKDCTLGSTFINVAAGRLSGKNLDVTGFRSIAECQQDCLDNPKCRGIEHSTFCYLSDLTRDMVNPDAFVVGSYHYSERICN